MPLKGKSPEAVEKRLKLFMFGDYGVGKTTAAIQFPKSYIIDCERGAENDSYVQLMKKGGSALLQTNDVDEIVGELRTLVTEEHPYKTVVLDPITTLESDLIEKAQKKFPGDNDMRVWRDRDQSLRRITNLLLKSDMNVIVTAHGKVDYGPNMVKLGTTFDGWKRWPYLFDLVVELKRSGTDRIAVVRKTRVKNFQDGEEFPWSYAEFQKRYGGILDKGSAPIKLASKEQAAELSRLVSILKIDEDTIEKWNSKAGADTWEEYPADVIDKCISYCHKLIGKEK